MKCAGWLGCWLLAIVVLSGCASQLANSDLGRFVGTDLEATRDNFSSVGMATEAACVQKVIDKIGAESQSNLQVKGLVSLGSIAYIEYAKVYGSGAVKIPDECYAIIGKVTTAVGKRGANAFGGGLIP